MQSGIFLPAGTALSNKTDFFRVPVGILSCTGRNSFVYRSEFFCVPTGILSCTGRNSFVYRPVFFCMPVVTGTFKLAGHFSCVGAEILDFSCIAYTGKNTNFGLGQLDFRAKWE